MFRLLTKIAILVTAVGLSAVFHPISSRADVIAELQFNNPQAVAGGATVKCETVAKDASPEMKLMPESKVSADATGISDKWQEFLGKGFLEVPLGSGENSAEKFGMISNSTTGEGDDSNAGFEKYFGFSGLGTDKTQGGTIYMVVSPLSNWKGGARRGLFGSGQWFGLPTSPWAIGLWDRDGTLRIDAGRGEQNSVDLNGDGDQKDFVYASVTVTREWKPGAWYFVAASWQEGAAPVLFVREMSSDGPEKSPAGVAGKPAPAKQGVIDKCPVDTNQTTHDPIAIGALWINHGNAQTREGAEAKIAFVRIENTFTPSTEAMDKVFASLAAK